jgi:hypothetical protein
VLREGKTACAALVFTPKAQSSSAAVGPELSEHCPLDDAGKSQPLALSQDDRTVVSLPRPSTSGTLRSRGETEAAMARHERFGVPAHSRALLRGLKMDEGASAKDMPGNMDQLAPP